MPSDESKGNQLDAIGSLAQRQLDNTYPSHTQRPSRRCNNGATGTTKCVRRKKPRQVFMKQVALDLAAFDDSFLRGYSHLTIDRDSKYTTEFREVPEGKRRGHRPDSDQISELQSSRGAFRALGQTGVPEQDGLVWTECVGTRSPPISSPLSA